MQAKDLKVGQRFTIPTERNTTRNLVCLRQSYTATVVDGEQLEDKKLPNGKITSVWVRLKSVYRYLSTSTTIEADSTLPLVEITKNEDGVLVAASFPKEQEKEKPEKKFGNGTGKRGRARINIIFPKGKFMIPDLANELNCSPTVIYLRLQDLKKKGQAKIVDETENARGRSSKWWKVI